MKFICSQEKFKIPPKNGIPFLGAGPRDPRVWPLGGWEELSKGPRGTTVPSFLCILKQREFLAGVLRMITEKTSHPRQKFCPRQKFLTVSGIIGGGFSNFSGISGGGLLLIKNLVVVILRAPAKNSRFWFHGTVPFLLYIRLFEKKKTYILGYRQTKRISKV